MATEERFNPFPMTGYTGPEFFCDREVETQRLIDAAKSQSHVVIYSPRKLGKSGLIQHSFQQLSPKKSKTIYVDLFHTESLEEFIQEIGLKSLAAIETQSERIIRKALEVFQSLRPQVSFDPMTGSPNLSVTVESTESLQKSLRHVFDLLESQKQKVVIALDEFQQITTYGGHALEALIRAELQRLKNTTVFISGSAQHLLIPMFSDPSRPLYQGADFLALKKLDPDIYGAFIKGHFKARKRKITDEVIAFILEWSYGHTYYTQLLCHRLFNLNKKALEMADVQAVIHSIFDERELIFSQLRKSLATQQWKLLEAISCEGEIAQVTGKEFLQKYQLGAHSTVRKSLDALIERDFVLEEIRNQITYYRPYDVILGRWLAR